MGQKINVTQRTLRDVRDTNSYTVRKLADGNCWMTSNLKYTLTANSTAIGVNHSTNETFTFNTGAACETNGSCIMDGNTVMIEQVTNGGYYYNWYAATAGTGTASMTSGDATGSICPKGWRLPANYTSSASKSYGGLTLAYLGYATNRDSTDDYEKLESAPTSFIRAGTYRDSTLYDVGVHGRYWSSTAGGNSEKGMFFGYHATLVYPQAESYKIFGVSVRCMAQ